MVASKVSHLLMALCNFKDAKCYSKTDLSTDKNINKECNTEVDAKVKEDLNDFCCWRECKPTAWFLQIAFLSFPFSPLKNMQYE